MIKKFFQASLLTSLMLASLSANASSFPGNNRTGTTFDISKEVAALSAAAPNLNPKVLKLALTAYDNATSMGYPVRKNVLTVVDYSLPDNDKRLWVLDLSHDKVLYNTFVAHGQGSGGLYAKHFSDQHGTHESSVGVYLTKDTYVGSDGYSLRLAGLDKGFNDDAASRAVIMHGAWYVNAKFAQEYGHIGRSWGCLALSQRMARPIINTIKDGSVIFAYAPNFSWLHESRFLNA